MSQVVERPLVFGTGSHLFGVECRPAVPREGCPSVLFINAGIVHRVGPHRIYVTLARALARNGIPSLRFDLSGLGSSRPRPNATGPREAAVRGDIDDALVHLESSVGAGKVVTVGLCSGADRAFDTALRHDRIVGAALLDPDVHLTRGHRLQDIRAALGRGQTWASIVNGRYLRRALTRGPKNDGTSVARRTEELAVTTLPPQDIRAGEIKRLLDRNVALHFHFTGGLLERYNHRDQLFEAYPDVRSHPGVSLTWFPEADHTFSAELAQETLVSDVMGWFDRRFPPAGQS